jgi:hypothetical protein
MSPYSLLFKHQLSAKLAAPFFGVVQEEVDV